MPKSTTINEDKDNSEDNKDDGEEMSMEHFFADTEFLAEIIAKKKKCGDSRKQISDFLKEEGYNEDDIAEAWDIYEENKKKKKNDNETTDQISSTIEKIKIESEKIFKNSKEHYYGDVFGNDDAIKKIQQFHIRRRAMENDGKSYHNGLIFCGEPRTGKGTTFTAMINEDLNPNNDIVIQLSSMDLISGNLKESAGNVKRMIDICRIIRDKENKSIHILLDEAERKIPGRETNSHNQGTLSSTWLEEFGGMKEIDRIYLYPMTNDIRKFDKAFVDYGRSPNIVEFFFPNKESRIKAFKYFLNDLIPDADYEKFANITNGESVAFIKHVCKEIDSIKLSERVITHITNDRICEEILNQIDEEDHKNELMGIEEENDDIDEFTNNVITFAEDKKNWSFHTPTELSRELNAIKQKGNPLCKLYTAKSVGKLLKSDVRKRQLEDKGITVEKERTKDRLREKKYRIYKTNNKDV